jgi:hypothetical protein
MDSGYEVFATHGVDQGAGDIRIVKAVLTRP